MVANQRGIDGFGASMTCAVHQALPRYIGPAAFIQFRHAECEVILGRYVFEARVIELQREPD